MPEIVSRRIKSAHSVEEGGKEGLWITFHSGGGGGGGAVSEFSCLKKQLHVSSTSQFVYRSITLLSMDSLVPRRFYCFSRDQRQLIIQARKGARSTRKEGSYNFQSRVDLAPLRAWFFRVLT